MLSDFEKAKQEDKSKLNQEIKKLRARLMAQQQQLRAGKLPVLVLIEGWSAGYLREDGYHVMAEAMRSRRRPELSEALDVPMYAGQLCLALYDARGGSYYYSL